MPSDFIIYGQACFRIQPPAPQPIGVPHCDAHYGHQAGKTLILTLTLTHYGHQAGQNLTHYGHQAGQNLPHHGHQAGQNLTCYGHQAGQINFWLPLVDVEGSSTLHVESSPGQGDFHPLNLKYGEVARFYGNQCIHYTVPNDTDTTRLSLDFRVVPGGVFNPNPSVARGQYRVVEGGFANATSDPNQVREGGEAQCSNAYYRRCERRVEGGWALWTPWLEPDIDT